MIFSHQNSLYGVVYPKYGILLHLETNQSISISVQAKGIKEPEIQI